MEHIREALEKTKASELAPAPQSQRPVLNEKPVIPANGPAPSSSPQTAPWTPPHVELNSKHLDRHRIVANAATGPNLVPFNLLRTKIRKITADFGWRSLGITSPTPGCGKTMISANLALSLARTGDLRVVLVDLDLRKPSLARTLGIHPPATVRQFLNDEVRAEDCFVSISPSVFVGLNGGALNHSSEAIRSPRMDEFLEFIETRLAPDLVLFDMPPMGSGDDVLTFLPHVDSMILVAAAGTTTIAEIDECERSLAEQDKFCGVVLNKGEMPSKDYYYY